MRITKHILIAALAAVALLLGAPAFAANETSSVNAVRAEASLVEAQGSTAPVTEGTVLSGGADGDGYNLLDSDEFVADAGQRVFVLSHANVSAASVRVSVDGVPLRRDEYVVESGAGRVTVIGDRLSGGASVRVSYRYGEGERSENVLSFGSDRLSLGFLYEDGNGDITAPTVQGGSLGWQGTQNLNLSFGYVRSAPGQTANYSYMREQFARAVAQERGVRAQGLPSQVSAGRAAAFGMALQGNGFSLKSDYWTVDPHFELPSGEEAQGSLKSMLTAHGADGNVKKNIGMEHLANALQVQLPRGFNWTGQYTRDENRQEGHKEYGLIRNVWQQNLSGSLGRSRNVSFSQVTTRDARDEQRTKNVVNTLSLEQKYSVDGLKGVLTWSRQDTRNTDEVTGENSGTEVETYGWDGALVRNFGVAAKVTITSPEGGARQIERVIDTKGGGIRLNGSMALTGHYEETEIDGQGSKSKMVIGLPKFAVNDRMAFEGSYVAQKDPGDLTTRESIFKADLKPAHGFTANLQWRGVETEGQRYLREAKISLSKSLGATTSLSAQLARQEQGDAKVSASKEIALQHSSRLLEAEAIYQEFAETGEVHPRLVLSTNLKAIPGVTFKHFLVHRDDNEFGGALTREWEVGTRVFSRFNLTGGYVANPVKKRAGEYKVKDNTRVRSWTLAGPLSDKLQMNFNWQLSKNGEPDGWQRASTLSLTRPLSPKTKVDLRYGLTYAGGDQERRALGVGLTSQVQGGDLEVLLALQRNYAAGQGGGQQGILVNYAKQIDDNHSFRLSLCDQPGKFDLFGNEKKCGLALADDAKWSVEYKTAF